MQAILLMYHIAKYLKIVLLVLLTWMVAVECFSAILQKFTIV